MKLLKYPRTQHLEGSRLQPGDEDLSQVRWSSLKGRHLVVEEKIDGANAALSFDAAGRLKLQSRGHFLTGGARERHFALFKGWAACHQEALLERIGTRYVVYGEWLYARHTIYYDRLPHYFLEFDCFDREEGVFLSTEARRALLAGLPLASVPVLWSGVGQTLAAVTELVGPSLYRSPGWLERLRQESAVRGLDVERCVRETDRSSDAEGLYLKWEEGGRVLGRYKWIRASFHTAVLDSGSHWLDRPIVPNQLAPGVDLYAPTLPGM